MKKIIKLVLISILSIGLVACGSKGISKEDFIKDYTESYAKMSDFTNVGIDMDTVVTADKQSMNMNISMDVFAADTSDLENVEMYMTMSTTDLDMDMYLVNKVAYFDMLGQKGQMPLTEEVFNQLSDTNITDEYVKNPEDIFTYFDYVKGTKVEGGSEYVLKPNKQFLDEVMGQQGLDTSELKDFSMDFIYFISDDKEVGHMNANGKMTSKDGDTAEIKIEMKLREAKRPTFNPDDYQKVDL